MTRREWLRVGVRSAVGAGVVVGVPRQTAAETTGHDHAAQSRSGPLQNPGSQDSLVGTLSSPWAAGQDRARVTSWDNDPFIIDIENRLKCICGCAHSIYVCRTTDFSCGFWQALHADIIAKAEQNMTADQIVDAYVSEHGGQFLMAPPPRGFNLAGYFVPGVLISLVAGAMFWVLKRRTAQMVPVTTAESEWAGFSDVERQKLEEELRTLDT